MGKLVKVHYEPFVVSPFEEIGGEDDYLDKWPYALLNFPFYEGMESLTTHSGFIIVGATMPITVGFNVFCKMAYLNTVAVFACRNADYAVFGVK